MTNCLFCNIASGKMGTIFLYEDDHIVAFHDIDLQAPFHILIMPKAHKESAADLAAQDGAMLAQVFAVAAKLTQEAGYTNGYRVVTNIGRDGAQSVQHLHFHVLAGRQLGWPPG